jgi:peptidoglycan/LPS O-acetylase OafA/YrhL
MNKPQPTYFPNLDGWRFLCFLSVFFYHSFHTEVVEVKMSDTYHFITKEIFGNGNLGVNFFFVLSGFLITYLLFHEKHQNGKIDLRSFWMRRLLRIWPLFYFCVFFGFVIFPLIKIIFGQAPSETANPLMYLLFLNNFDLLANGLPDASVLGVLWSIAIEEQFYLIWPVILAVVPFKRSWFVFFFIILVSIISRVMNPTYMFSEYHTISCIGDMAVGGFGAWLILRFRTIQYRIETLSRSWIIFVYLWFILMYFFRDEIFTQYSGLKSLDRFIIALLIIFVILEQNYAKNSFFKMKEFKLFSKLGKYTYGMYCLHFVAILITLKLTQFMGLNKTLWEVVFLETTMALILTALIAYLSYRYLESPFLKLKAKFTTLK